MRPTLYLIDGTALLYRSHFAFIKNPLVNSRGEHTSAIFGVVNSFLHILELKRAEHILISFDRKAPTFRHELSEDYKANRPPMPDELVAQIEPVQRFFQLIGLPEISLDGYEADDVLAHAGRAFQGPLRHRVRDLGQGLFAAGGGAGEHLRSRQGSQL